MAKTISLAKQILGILEDAGRPMFLKEIVDGPGGDFNSVYIQPFIGNLLKAGYIKSMIKMVPAIKGEKKLTVYFLNEERI